MRRSIVEAIDREPDLVVCGQSDDVKEAFAAILVMELDLVLTDIHLKSSSGLDLIKAIHEHLPGLPIVATTMFDGLRNERLARAAGASGFVSKDEGPERLIAAVHAALRQAKNAAQRL
jgi:DNA-binding NarL/FixJ family response regulator